MAEVGTLEEQALKRKERLRNLRNQQHNEDNKTTENEKSDEEKSKLPRPVFRSYKPQDESLRNSALPQLKPADVTEKVQSQMEAGKTDKILDEVDLINLAPRKPDWDLKRDVAKKLEKLERRTQRAIAELIRERLKAGSEDLAMVVNAGEADKRNIDEDDDND